MEQKLTKKSASRPSLNRDFHTLIHLVCESIHLFRDYDPRKIALSLSSSRGRGVHGTLAYVVPLRYVGGSSMRKSRRGLVPGYYEYKSKSIEQHQPEALYLMTFLVPKFFRLSSEQRLETIVHEIYHLHPSLRGDLRRFQKPHIHHGPTPAAFQRRVRELMSEALGKSPFLMEHPIMRMSPEDLKRYSIKHYSIPKRSFVPDTQIFESLPNLMVKLLGVIFLLSAITAKANLAVRLKSDTLLQGRPVPGSQVVFEAEQGTRFQAIKQSGDKKWVFIQNDRVRGWVPKDRLVSMASGVGRSSRSNTEVDVSRSDFSVDEDLENFDLRQASAMAAIASELYSEPDLNSEKYSRIEKGDELQILRRSDSGRWYQVRLLVTGEEGWLPADSVVTEDFDRVSRGEAHSIQLNAQVGSDRLGYGLGVGYFHNLLSLGMSDRPRDRFEFGLEVDYFYKSFSVESFPVTRNSFLWTAGARFLPSVANGRFFGILHLGLGYIFSTYSSELSEEELVSERAKENTHTFAIAVGGGLGINATQNLSIYLLSRLYLRSNLFFTAGMGAGWRF